jgi:hypothetical protein
VARILQSCAPWCPRCPQGKPSQEQSQFRPSHESRRRNHSASRPQASQTIRSLFCHPRRRSRMSPMNRLKTPVTNRLERHAIQEKCTADHGRVDHAAIAALVTSTTTSLALSTFVGQAMGRCGGNSSGVAWRRGCSRCELGRGGRCCLGGGCALAAHLARPHCCSGPATPPCKARGVSLAGRLDVHRSAWPCTVGTYMLEQC